MMGIVDVFSKYYGYKRNRYLKDVNCKLLSGVSPEAGVVDVPGSDTVIPMGKTTGFQETMEGWIEEIKTGDIEKKAFWTALSAVGGILGLGILVISITLAVTILSGGAALAVGIAGGVIGGGLLGYGTAGTVMFSQGDPMLENVFGLKNSEKFQQYLDDYTYFMKQLPKE